MWYTNISVKLQLLVWYTNLKPTEFLAYFQILKKYTIVRTLSVRLPKQLPKQLKFWWKIPIFIITRPWFSFWACASSFSEKSFLFFAVIDSWWINTLAIKCDELSDDYNFCYKAVRSSLIIIIIGKLNLIFNF